MNESPPLSNGIASKNKFSSVGAPLEIICTVIIDSGLSQTSCLAIMLQSDCNLVTCFLLCRLRPARFEFPWTEKVSLGTGPEMVGMR